MLMLITKQVPYEWTEQQIRLTRLLHKGWNVLTCPDSLSCQKVIQKEYIMTWGQVSEVIFYTAFQ